MRVPPDEMDYYARLFASLGADAEVISPPELRRRLYELGQRLSEKYQKL